MTTTETTAFPISSMTLDDLVGKTSDLPSLPAAAMAVMRETESADGTAQSVAKQLMQDQALTARVLRLANSAFYGLSRQVVDVPECVVVLGMRTIRNLSLVASTYPWLTRPLRGYELGPDELWRHSLSVAVGSQLVAQHVRTGKSEVAFTCGLLHNIGKVLLSVWLEGRLNDLHKQADQEGMTLEEAERRFLGYDHAEAGAHLADRWNLPKPLVDAIRYHHTPELCIPTSVLVDCVHVADWLSVAIGLGIDGEGFAPTLSEDAVGRLRLTPLDLEALQGAVRESYEQHEKLFQDKAA
jgi:putative nucleotidyltransferase with HDIG domain